MKHGFMRMDQDELALFIVAVLAPIGRLDRIRQLLTSLDYLSAKLVRLGVEALLADFQTARGLTPGGTAQPLQVIETALVRSARILGADPAQLPAQLLARMPRGVAADIDALLGDAAAWRGSAWLRPLTLVHDHGYAASFGPVGGFVDALAVSDERPVVLAGDRRGGLHAWDLDTGELLWKQTAQAAVNALRFLPGSFEALVALNDGTIARWSLADRRLRPWLRASRPVTSLATDGTVLTYGSGAAITVQSLAAGEPSWEGCQHEDSVTAVVILDDGQRCVSGSHDGSLAVWRLADGRLLRHIPLSADRVLCVAAVPGTGLVAAGTRDGLVVLAEAGTGRTTVLRGHKNQVRSVTALADGRVASGSYDGQVLVWDLATHDSRCAGTHTTWCLAVAAIPGGSRVASGSDDGVVRVWDVDSPVAKSPQQALSPQKHHVRALITDATTAYAAVDRVITRIDLATGQALPWLIGHHRPVVALAATPSGLVSGSYDKTLRLWDVTSGQARVLKGHRSGVDAIAVTPNGSEVVSVSRDGTWRRWDAATGAAGPVVSAEPFNSVLAISPDGEVLVTVSGDHVIEVWQRRSGRRLFPLTGHDGFVERLAITPDGQVLLSASWDRSLRAWSLRSGELLRVFYHADWVVDLAVTADGRLALTACQDGRISLFDITGLELAATIDAHTGGVSRLALSPGDRIAFSIGSDRFVRAWDMASRSLIGSFDTDIPLREITVSPSGLVIVGTSLGSTLLLQLEQPAQSSLANT